MKRCGRWCAVLGIIQICLLTGCDMETDKNHGPRLPVHDVMAGAWLSGFAHVHW